MKACLLPLGQLIAPFGDHPGELEILGETLRSHQRKALAAVGVELCDTPPEDAPWLALGDHTWVTAPLLRLFLAACPSAGGQLQLESSFVEFTRSLQSISQQGPARFPLAVVPPGPVESLDALPAVEVDLRVKEQHKPLHPVFAHADQGPIPVTDAMIHTVGHWSHLLRINLLALLAYAEGEKRRFEDGSWWLKLRILTELALRLRTLDRWKAAERIGVRGKGCSIHPTATVEASVLGDNVEVGPHAVVRASWLGDGVSVGEHARVNLTVAGPGAQLGRGLMANLCVLFSGAFVSQGFGYQACVFGRDAFVAMGATAYDLSFGKDIRVWHNGEWTSAETKFLGACIGHRAKVGPHVILGYGEAVPNEAFLVADPARIWRRIPPQLPTDRPLTWRDGAIVPVGRPKPPDD